MFKIVYLTMLRGAILIFLVCSNLLLGVVLVQRTRQLSTQEQALKASSVPVPERRAVYLIESISESFPKDDSVWQSHVQSFERVEQLLVSWQPYQSCSNSSLFEKSATPVIFYDTLRQALQMLHQDTDALLTHFSRKRQRYSVAHRAYRDLLADTGMPMKELRTRLDQLHRKHGFWISPNYDVRGDLAQLVSSLEYRSDPTEEFQLNVLLNRLSAFAEHDGFFQLYGREYRVGTLQCIEDRQLFDFVVQLNTEVTRLLSVMSRK